MRPENFVSETPDINGGYPVVAGSRTPVSVIVEFWQQTHDLEQIARLLPHLTLEQLRGALAYYALYPQRIDEDIALDKQALADLQGHPWPALGSGSSPMK
jgi:uncharacterized protein (DUF433 family)